MTHGRHAGSLGTVIRIEEGYSSPILVNPEQPGVAVWLTPEEIHIPTGGALTECSALFGVTPLAPHPEFNSYSGATRVTIVGANVWLIVTDRMNEGHSVGVSMSLEQWENFRQIGDNL